MFSENKLLLFLFILALIDTVIPIPFTALILVYVVIQKPDWFINQVDKIYRRTE